MGGKSKKAEANRLNRFLLLECPIKLTLIARLWKSKFTALIAANAPGGALYAEKNRTVFR